MKIDLVGGLRRVGCDGGGHRSHHLGVVRTSLLRVTELRSVAQRPGLEDVGEDVLHEVVLVVVVVVSVLVVRLVMFLIIIAVASAVTRELRILHP